MSYDGIDHLTGCGYSEREAAFLYIVAVHSGYFLRRQFNRFVSRERGAIATYFLRRATELNHITELPCAEGRRIYHLSDRQVYRLVGLDSSQGRRIKSPGEILRRLMTLDYVLRHLDGERFIETQEAKRQLFTQLRVRPEAIQDAESFRHLVPLSLVEGPESSAVHLAFLDEGQRSSSLFVRFLSTHAQLLRSLPVAEIIYVSTVTTQFMQARRLFERHTPLRNTMSPACPRGIEHLVSWLEVRHRFHERGGSISPSDHRLLLEGDGLYNAPIHKGLIASWKNGAMNAEKVHELFHREQHRVSFVTELLDTDYPRSINPAPGYSAGYDDSQNSLFDKDLEPEKQEIQNG